MCTLAHCLQRWFPELQLHIAHSRTHVARSLVEVRSKTGVLMAQKGSNGSGSPVVQKSTALQQWPSMYNEVLEHLLIRCAVAGDRTVVNTNK